MRALLGKVTDWLALLIAGYTNTTIEPQTNKIMREIDLEASWRSRGRKSGNLTSLFFYFCLFFVLFFCLFSISATRFHLCVD